MRVKNAARTERRKGDAVTIHEVARHAGVSPMTVSRVMNSNSNVRDTTRERVMRAVRELNYTPNAAARSLAGAQGTRIALIYTNPSAAYLSELLVGALAGAGPAQGTGAPASDAELKRRCSPTPPASPPG